MPNPPFDDRDVSQLGDAADRLKARLGLAGYDDESITRADAWMDSPEFQQAWAEQRAAVAYDLGAYLGQAVIERVGGAWAAVPDKTPQVKIERNGTHFVSPFGKVQKRAANGSEDHLLGLVKLADEVSSRAPHDPTKTRSSAYVAMDRASRFDRSGANPAGCAGTFFVGVVLFPMIVLIILSRFLNGTQTMIGAVVGLGLGLLAFIRSFVRMRRAAGSRFADGTLASEAELTLAPLSDKLGDELAALDADPGPETSLRVAFYSAQLNQVADIVYNANESPGRGYVGFDTYGTTESSWAKAAPGSPSG
jgi:hypothetical protein